VKVITRSRKIFLLNAIGGEMSTKLGKRLPCQWAPLPVSEVRDQGHGESKCTFPEETCLSMACLHIDAVSTNSSNFSSSVFMSSLS